MFMQYGNIVQCDWVAGPYTFHYFITISIEHKITSLSVEDLGTATKYNQVYFGTFNIFRLDIMVFWSTTFLIFTHN